jgi:hypothetical protein
MFPDYFCKVQSLDAGKDFFQHDDYMQYQETGMQFRLENFRATLNHIPEEKVDLGRPMYINYQHFPQGRLRISRDGNIVASQIS